MRRCARPRQPDQASGRRGLAAGLPDAYGSGRRGRMWRMLPGKPFTVSRGDAVFRLPGGTCLACFYGRHSVAYSVSCFVPEAKYVARLPYCEAPGFLPLPVRPALCRACAGIAVAVCSLCLCGADAQQLPHHTGRHQSLGVECQHVVHPPSLEAGGFLPRAECGRKKLYRCVHIGR